ncbi:hypothetical protein PAPYR_3532 [Paratrimastix pyriformis]|uniref:Uncharacterized protein n=1 Tax=Paratrimastix pyriformis TaxID=342808 RepID=A0ABQ8UMX4_9EUKA|nr:hypothetical protein PAPYR_3532 [Paratrimastix pyriformis]
MPSKNFYSHVDGLWRGHRRRFLPGPPIPSLMPCSMKRRFCTIASERELRYAFNLAFQSNHLLRVRVTRRPVASGAAPMAVEDDKLPETPVHPHVTCDACQRPITGIRQVPLVPGLRSLPDVRTQARRSQPASPLRQDSDPALLASGLPASTFPPAARPLNFAPNRCSPRLSRDGWTACTSSVSWPGLLRSGPSGELRPARPDFGRAGVLHYHHGQLDFCRPEGHHDHEHRCPAPAAPAPEAPKGLNMEALAPYPFLSRALVFLRFMQPEACETIAPSCSS